MTTTTTTTTATPRRDEPDPREPSLPKWAQVKVESLRRLATELQERLSARRPSRVSVDATVDERIPTEYLPDDARVKFTLGPGAMDFVEVHLDRLEPELVIRAGDLIALMPEASNTIRVRLPRLVDEEARNILARVNAALGPTIVRLIDEGTLAGPARASDQILSLHQRAIRAEREARELRAEREGR